MMEAMTSISTRVAITHDVDESVTGVIVLSRIEGRVKATFVPSELSEDGSNQMTLGEVRRLLSAIIDLIEIRVLPETKENHGT